MPVVPVSVKRSRRTQQDLQDRREHASASPQLLAAAGCVVRQQVRVRRNGGVDALYTISETQDEQPDNIVRMGPEGRERLGSPGEVEGVVDPVAVHPTVSEADAVEMGEFIERLEDDGAHQGLIAIAPHGGDIEVHSDDEAECVAGLLADANVSSWRCKGWSPGGGALIRWHITSTDLLPASFPLLQRVATRGFAHAVAFHGLDDTDQPTDVLIGGAAPRSLKLALRAEIRDAVAGSGLVVRIAGSGDSLGGSSLDNIVNRLTANKRNGIQIEQSLRARTEKWLQIATAVATVYRAELG